MNFYSGSLAYLNLMPFLQTDNSSVFAETEVLGLEESSNTRIECSVRSEGETATNFGERTLSLVKSFCENISQSSSTKMT